MIILSPERPYLFSGQTRTTPIAQEKKSQLLRTNAHDSKQKPGQYTEQQASKRLDEIILQNSTSNQLEPLRKLLSTISKIDLQSSLQVIEHPTQKLNLLMNVPTRSKR